MVSKLLRTLGRKVNPTPSTSRHPARDKVVQTYELLAHILGYLEPHWLRQARLVNKYWQTIIHNSSVLSLRSTASDKWRQLRTVLIGPPGAGMNSLVNRFIVPEIEFPYPFDPTWEPSFRKQLTVDEESWLIDGTSGGYLDERQHASYLGHMLANCDTYVLIYAMTSRDSFERVKAWVARMKGATEPLSTLISTQTTDRKQNIPQCIPGVLVSTKNDLPIELRAVEPSEGAAFARELGCPFVETSSKTGDGVEQAFVEMCRTYKRVRLERLRRQAKRSSLTKAISPATPNAKQRKERWWNWYGAKQQPS